MYDLQAFQTASCVGTVLPVSHKQCIDLPWTDPNFLFGHFTPEQADFLFDWEQGKTIYKQVSGEASINGTLAQMPAGPVGVALGSHGSAGQYQRYARRNHSCRQCVGLKRRRRHGRAFAYQRSVWRNPDTARQGSAVLQGPFTLGSGALHERRECPRQRRTYRQGQWQFYLQARRQLGSHRLAPFPRNLWYVVPRSRSVRGVQGGRDQLRKRTNKRSVRQLAFNLAQGNISQRIFDNCRSQGFGLDYGGGSDHRDVPFPGRHRATRSGNVDRENGQRHPDATLRFSAEDAPEPCGRLFQHRSEERGRAAGPTEYRVRLL